MVRDSSHHWWGGGKQSSSERKKKIIHMMHKRVSKLATYSIIWLCSYYCIVKLRGVSWRRYSTGVATLSRTERINKAPLFAVAVFSLSVADLQLKVCGDCGGREKTSVSLTRFSITKLFPRPRQKTFLPANHHTCAHTCGGVNICVQ